MPSRLGISEKLCETPPPLVLAIKSAEESSRWKSYPGGDSSPLANTALVSSSSAHVNRCTKCLPLNCLHPTANCSPPTLAHQNPLRLIAWLNSGKLSLRTKFQKKLEKCSQLLGDKEPIRIMTQLGESGKAARKRVCYFDVSKISTHFCVLF